MEGSGRWAVCGQPAVLQQHVLWPADRLGHHGQPSGACPTDFIVLIVLFRCITMPVAMHRPGEVQRHACQCWFSPK